MIFMHDKTHIHNSMVLFIAHFYYVIYIFTLVCLCNCVFLFSHTAMSSNNDDTVRKGLTNTFFIIDSLKVFEYYSLLNVLSVKSKWI